ncbi:MAG: ABATE domain-containing protein [Actinomycetota bacterium]|nr:ABATE domain-containing protein [Actinomycetota bacterium]
MSVQGITAGNVQPLQFRFLSGRLSLDFANTLAGRGGSEVELLATVSELGEWLHQAGLTALSPSVGTYQLQEARKLREAIARAALAASGETALPPDEVAQLNAGARYPVAPRLDAEAGAVSWDAAHVVPGALARIARDAVELLGAAERSRIRTCARPGCGALFVDSSRKGNRRWCSMQGCGNRAKVATYRHKGRSRSRGSPA